MFSGFTGCWHFVVLLLRWFRYFWFFYLNLCATDILYDIYHQNRPSRSRLVA